jgi:cell cycle sensor histidine kinase DivJ
MLIKSLELPTKIDLEEFISEEAHDLRSPFNQVIGFGKMLINTVKDQPFSDVQKDDLNTVYRSGMRALLLMNALVDIARLNRGEKTVSPGEIRIEVLLENSLAQWKKFHPGADLQIQHHILTTSATLQTDELLTQQIITGTIAYVALFCGPKATVTLIVEEEADGFVFTFTSKGTKSQAIQKMDLEMMGYVNRACVELQGGSIRRAEENDDGAVIQFILRGK